MLSKNEDWCLAQLKPNSAQIADKNLKRQGFDTFLPLEERTRQRKGKFVTELHPIFPGYIFIAFNAQDGWSAINSTYGITQLVSFGKEPALVPSSLIAQLKLRCDTNGTLRPLNLMKAGDRVRLTKGPFANLFAEIETSTPDQRVWVLMDIMGSKIRMKMSATQLRPA